MSRINNKKSYSVRLVDTVGCEDELFLKNTLQDVNNVPEDEEQIEAYTVLFASNKKSTFEFVR